MNTLSCEQLMQIIVELDTSYRKQLAEKNLQIEASACLLYDNESEENQRVEMVDWDKCYLCNVIITNYKYGNNGFYNSQEFLEEVDGIFKCEVCNKRTCSDCNWAQGCRTCFHVRKKAIECKEIIDKIKKANN